MLEIKNTNVYDLEESIVRSGFPMNLGNLIDEFPYNIACVKEYLATKDDLNSIFSTEQYEVGKKHVSRATKLGKVKTGTGHDNFLKGIKVSFDLKYPEYISPQLQRYNWFDIVSSQSKMHRITKLDLRKSVNEYVTNSTVTQLNTMIESYNSFDHHSSKNVTKDRITAGISIDGRRILLTKHEMFMYIISNTPLGLEKWMGVSTNYMQLKTIYLQRKSHKLKEDYKVLCDWIEALPLFKELCLSIK